MMLGISASAPPASGQQVMPACQTSPGRPASNLRQDERGRLCGWGVTKPRRDKIRQIVATDGGDPPDCRRKCQAMVSAPAS